MKRRSLHTILFLAAAAVLTTNCNSWLSPEGKQVKFSASARNQSLTRTVYAGNYAETGSSHEDIYWSEGDLIRIYSSNTDIVATPSGGASADYSLTVSSDRTRAKLNNTASNGLVWQTDDGSQVVFYGVYPPATMSEEAESYGKFALQIPKRQDYKTPTETVMSYASMMSKKSLTDPGENVSLDFYPAFSAFQINLRSADAPLILKRFRI